MIWLAALAWLLYRQLQKRPIGRRSAGARRGARGQIAIVLFLIGIVQFVAFSDHHQLGAGSAGILSLSFLVGGGLSLARGFTVRLWVEQGQLFRQGTAITLLLWLLAIGLRLGSEHLIEHEGGPAGAGSASMLLYLALSLTIQTRVLRRRARATLTALRRGPERAPAAT